MSIRAIIPATLLVSLISTGVAIPASNAAGTQHASTSAEDRRETAEWLKGHLTQLIPTRTDGVHSIQVESLERCKLTIVESWSAAPAVYRHSVSLRELDTANHKIAPIGDEDNPFGWSLQVPTRSGQSTVRTCPRRADGLWDSPLLYAKEIEFLFPDRDIANRASQALSHPITMCGGKKSRF